MAKYEIERQLKIKVLGSWSERTPMKPRLKAAATNVGQ